MDRTPFETRIDAVTFHNRIVIVGLRLLTAGMVSASSISRT